MKLLSHTLPQVRQFLRQPRVFTSVVMGTLIGLEIFGRSIASDVYDTISATGLMMLMALVVLHHREQPLGWVNWLERTSRRVFDWFDRFRIEVGIDLRGTPPIPRRTPTSVWWTLGWFAIWGGMAFALWYFFPQGWRDVFVRGTYLGYLLLVTALWGILFLCGLGCIYLPIMLWSHLSPRTFYRSDSPKMSKVRSLIVVLTYVAVMATAGALLPMWSLIGFCGFVLLVLLAARLKRGRSEVSMIWRLKGSNRVFSVPSFRLTINFLTLLIVFCIALIMTACGGRVLESTQADNEMTITVVMGVFFAWTIPGMVISVAIGAFLFWLRDPSRPAFPAVHVAGYYAAENRSRLVNVFKKRNWILHFDPSLPQDTDVCIHLVESEKSQATEFDPSWPLHLSLEDLEEGSVFSRLERRDELQKRRLFYRGLRMIFREAHNRQFQQGSGYWMAPHLWFQPAMTRDEELDEREGSNGLMQTVGPPYREAFARVVRHHLFQILRAVEIDVIFVEDGVKFRNMKRVFKKLFEFFDKSRGQKRMEEIHFLGLPKVRAMIHDLELDMPFESNRYPEPKYELIGRARVLHIFRDRGDQEDLIQVPWDFSWLPAPMKLK